MRLRLVAALGVIVLVGIGVVLWVVKRDVAQQSVAAVSGTDPVIMSPRGQSFPTIKVADAVGWPAGGAPIPAAGLAVHAFARGLKHPRWLYHLPNGDILAAETGAPPEESGGGIKAWVSDFLMSKAGADVPSANRITLLRDADGDGVADLRTVMLDGLNSPYGMALLGGYLYVGNTDALVRVPFVVGQTRVDAKPERVVSLPSGGHWARNVIEAPDGRTLFVAVGSSSNIAEKGLAPEKNRAAIWQVDPERRTARVFASGLRNPNG